MIFHLCRERVRADAESAAQREGVERNADVFVHKPPVHDRREFAVELGDKDIFILHAMPVVAEQLGVDARGDDVVVVALDVEQRLHVRQDVRDLIAVDLPDDHHFAARDLHELRRERWVRMVNGTKDLFKLHGHKTSLW